MNTLVPALYSPGHRKEFLRLHLEPNPYLSGSGSRRTPQACVIHLDALNGFLCRYRRDEISRITRCDVIFFGHKRNTVKIFINKQISLRVVSINLVEVNSILFY